jgi:hypothetical protein
VNAQLAIEFGEPTSSEEIRRRRFTEFHRLNPHVYAALRELALKASRAGKRVGMRCLWERLRWQLEVETVREEGEPKLNDHLAPYYARLLMSRELELAGFFETRSRDG